MTHTPSVLLVGTGSTGDAGSAQLRMMLEGRGFEVIPAAAGSEPLQAVYARHHDVIVVEAGPAFHDLLRAIRADSRLSSVPVIVTAEPGEAAAVSGWLALGADDCLVRPYQPALDAHRVEAARLKRTYRHQVQDLLRVVIPLSARLSTEADFNGLLERILVEAKDFCSADAGTLYLRTDEETLRFVLVRNDSLGLNMGGRSGGKVTLPDIPLYEIRPGQPSLPNHHNVASYAAHTEQTVNIPDAYHTPDFDFSGTRSFDARTGYHSVSFLTVPLRDNIDEVIGVLQLINARDVFTGDIIPFSPHLEPIVESIASLATVALKAYIREQQLRQQIGAPTISVDGERTERDVTQITETKYFQQLQDRARNLRGRARSDSTSAAGDRVDVDVQPG